MTPVNENRSQKGLIIFMGLILAAMLFSSLWQRFLHPDLVIHRIADHSRADTGMTEMDSAIGILMQRAARNPQDIEATLQLAENLIAIGQWQGAENFARKSLSLSSDNPSEFRPLYLLSLIHHNRGEHEQAAELLEKALEKKDNPSSRYNLGILYAHYLNKPERALEEFRRAASHEGLSPGLRAAIQEELKKITTALPGAQSISAPKTIDDNPPPLPQNN